MSFSAVKAGEAFVELTVKGRQKFATAIQQAADRMKRIATAAAQVAAATAAMATAAGVALGALAVRAAKTGDALHKMSSRTGASVEFLSQMGFAAEQSGSDLDTLGNALFRMRRRVANAATGSGAALRAIEAIGLQSTQTTKELKKLGIRAKEPIITSTLEGSSVEEQFSRIVGALSRVDDESLRAQYAFEIFGDQAKALIPLLNSGAVGIEQLRREADHLGRTMSTDQANAAAVFSDALNRVKTQVGGLSQQIGLALLPAMSHWLNEASVTFGVLSQLSRETQATELGVDNLGTAFNEAIDPAEALIRVFGNMTGSIRTVQSGLSDMAAAAVEAFGVMFSDAPAGFESELESYTKNMAAAMRDVAEQQREFAEENFGLADSEKIQDLIKSERRKLEELRDTAGLDFTPMRDLTDAVKEASEKFRSQGPLEGLERGTEAAVRKSQELEQQHAAKLLAETKKQTEKLEAIDRSLAETVQIEVVG